MLQQLHIQNYAIIEELDISFSDALNIITGETGAGKSILMGALGLILGERADSSVLQDKANKCIVEGTFHIKEPASAIQYLRDNDLDNEEELVIRREIGVNGKSRAFVNDTPVSLVQLRELGYRLVDLHQQFDTLELGNTVFQQEVLDAMAGNMELLRKYREVFFRYREEKKELEELVTRQEAANARQDYNQFLYDELAEASFSENELEELDSELKLLGNAETVKQQLEAACFTLKESDEPIVQQVKQLANKLVALESYHAGIPELVKRLQSAQLELADVAAELESINDRVQYSAQRIQWLNDRIALGYRLQKKHNVNSTAALLSIQDDLARQLNDLLNIHEAIRVKEKEVDALLDTCREYANRLSANRIKAVQPFSEKVNKLLVSVGMPNARFKPSVVRGEGLDESGADEIEFLFNANLPSGKESAKNPYEPLRKVASGGELSRLMLCIKSLVAERLQLPTLIFDEIDSGISGEAARQVGQIMKELSGSHQLIAITHQPQIAARATAHYFVYKSIRNDRIVTSVRPLSTEERITTIAQMMSGEKPTAAALQNAREMLGN